MGLFRKKLWLGMRVDRLELGACDLEFVCILYLGIFRGLRPGQGQRKKEDNRTVLIASPGGHIMHFPSIQSPSLQSAHVHCYFHDPFVDAFAARSLAPCRVPWNTLSGWTDSVRATPSG